MLRGLMTVLVALALAAPATAAVPENTTWTEGYIETPGEPTLHVDVLRPKHLPEGAKTPVIVNIGPYNGHSGQTTPGETPEGGPQIIYSELYDEGGAIERGYTIVQADLRGFGGSAGCNDFGGKGEQTDVKRIVEWAASQPWSTGKVGMWGKSYDGWTQVMALDEKPKGLAGAVIQAPIIDGYRTLYQNGVHYAAGWYVTPALYQQIDFIPPTPTDSPEYILGWAQGTNPACYGANIAQQSGISDPTDPFWVERELPAARGSDVPVFWAHGFMDANTKPDNFMPVWATLKGPSRAWFGQFAHDRASKKDHIVGRDGFLAESLRFLDRYVKGDTTAKPENDPRAVIQDGDGRWRGEAQWPPADARLRTMPLTTGTITDAPNNSAEGKQTAETGVGLWSFTAPLPHDAHLAGVPKVRLNVTTSATPYANVFVILYAVDPENNAKLISRAAHRVPSGDGTVEFELYPQDWWLPAGHRLGVLVAGSDMDWYLTAQSNQDVEVSRGQLELPFLAHRRTAFLDGDVASAQSSLRPVAINPAVIAERTVAADLPPALTAMPPAGVPSLTTPPAARPRAARLRVTATARRRTVTVRVRGVSGRVRVTLRRGATRVTRTATARRGLATVRFRRVKAGRYRIEARALGAGAPRPVRRSLRVR